MRDRNLWLLYLAFLVVGFNAAIPMVFGPFFVRATRPDASGTLYVALVFALPALTAFLGQNYWGGLFDHSGRYRPFLAGSFLVAALTFWLLTIAETAPQFVVLLALGTFFSVALIPIGQVYATVTYEESKGQVLGSLFAFEALGWGLACLMGATDWAEQSNLVFLDRLFWTCTGLSATTGALLWTGFSAPPPVREATGGSRLSVLIEEWSLLYHDRRIMRMSVVLFFLTMGSIIFLSFYTPYLCEELQGSKRLLGVSLAGGTFVAAISFPFYGRLSDRIGRRPLIFLATVGYILLYASFMFIRDAQVMAFLYAIPLYPAIRVATNAFLADLTDDRVRGGGLGLIEGVQAISGCVAPLIGYGVLQTFGYRGLPVAALLVMVLSASLVVRVLDLRAGEPLKSSLEASSL